MGEIRESSEYTSVGRHHVIGKSKSSSARHRSRRPPTPDPGADQNSANSISANTYAFIHCDVCRRRKVSNEVGRLEQGKVKLNRAPPRAELLSAVIRPP